MQISLEATSPKFTQAGHTPHSRGTMMPGFGAHADSRISMLDIDYRAEPTLHTPHVADNNQAWVAGPALI